jgi:hypothetical protein
MISEVTGESEESENFHLKELSELGYLLREEIDGFIFFSLNRI